LRETQSESLAQRRDAVEIHVDRVALVDPRHLRQIGTRLSEITKVLLEPGSGKTAATNRPCVSGSSIFSNPITLAKPSGSP
jgi:hypothetical protein